MISPSTEIDGFRELARMTCLPSDPAAAPSCEVIEILAQLLAAAASGNGALSLGKLKLPSTVLLELQKFPHLFFVDRETVRLPRYAHYSRQVHSFFEQRIANPAGHPQFDHEQVEQALNAIFGPQIIKNQVDGQILFDNAHQRLAVAGLLDAPVGILTGGPGTGKTATAAALLAIRKRLSPELSPKDILVAAPTGKAARRIAESITRASAHLSGLSPDEVNFLHALHAVTLHRALEWRPIPTEQGGPFQRNAERQLEAKLVLIDEASMVDLSLLHALIQALPAATPLLLLGDSDQLESVEVGGFLAELVRRSVSAPIPDSMAGRLEKRLGLGRSAAITSYKEGLPESDSLHEHPLPGLVFGLKASRRAMHAPWIIKLANLVRPGSTHSLEEVQDCFQSHPEALCWHKTHTAATRAEAIQCQWRRWAEEARSWHALSESSLADELLAPLSALNRFQLLCSTNHQVDQANREGIKALSPSSTKPSVGHPHGCPIIIQSNNHSLGLTNGDVGVALSRTPGRAASMGLFPSSSGKPQLVPLSQLPDHRPAFALTIHKSQGSEWSHVAIQLPPATGGAVSLLTKNLLYTAITRSSSRIDLFGQESVLLEILGPV